MLYTIEITQDEQYKHLVRGATEAEGVFTYDTVAKVLTWVVKPTGPWNLTEAELKRMLKRVSVPLLYGRESLNYKLHP